MAELTEYQKLVASLSGQDILTKWPEVVPVKNISGIPTSAGSATGESKTDLFEGHDEEQIKLMEELCIVLDYNDKPIGAGTKKLCHIMENIDAGLLHRAFSVFLFNEDGKLLLQQRADEKITFANMWTNTCCSHPLCVPDELGITAAANEDINVLENAVAGAKVAAQRKLEHELGIPYADSPLKDFEFLTRIHYKSPSGGPGSKWGEHEIDYILILQTKNDITVNVSPNEVRDIKWVDQHELKAMMSDPELVFTPWFKLICETLLFKWWDNLSDLSSFQDDELHRF